MIYAIVKQTQSSTVLTLYCVYYFIIKLYSASVIWKDYKWISSYTKPNSTALNGLCIRTHMMYNVSRVTNAI